MNFFEVRTPFFRPLWRRFLVVGLCLGWALFELVNGAAIWAAVYGLAGLWLAWSFFVTFEQGPAGREQEGDGDQAE